VVVDAAVILAGGGGRRLGGIDKPALRLGGRTLLQCALDAVPGATAVVVGPGRDLPASVRQVTEDPPGSGPAAALVAGLRAVADVMSAGRLPADGATVAVLAADLPGITAATVERLAGALGPGDGGPSPAGAVLVDADGRRQFLSGVFRRGPLLAAAGTADWGGRPVRALLDPLVDVEVPAAGAEAADVDTPEHCRRWGLADPSSGGAATS